MDILSLANATIIPLLHSLIRFLFHFSFNFLNQSDFQVWSHCIELIRCSLTLQTHSFELDSDSGFVSHLALWFCISIYVYTYLKNRKFIACVIEYLQSFGISWMQWSVGILAKHRSSFALFACDFMCVRIWIFLLLLTCWLMYADCWAKCQNTNNCHTHTSTQKCWDDSPFHAR